MVAIEGDLQRLIKGNRMDEEDGECLCVWVTSEVRGGRGGR